jgi:zinc transport system substrate-binding protein
MNRSMSTLAVLLALTIGTVACSGDTSSPLPAVEAAPKTGPVEVRVSSFPAEWLVRRVGGKQVTVKNVLPVGEDPPFWAPSGDVVASVQQAELIVANGAGFEKWMETATLPADRVVDSAKGLDLIHVQGKTHSHGKGGEHSHAGTDPHTWSDPLGYAQQAEAVHAALVRVRPDQKSVFDGNLAALKQDLSDLDRELKDALTPGKGLKMAANHPAFNYLARRYDLDIHSFDFDPEEVPNEEARADFATWAEGVDKPHHLIWESQPIDAVRRAFPAGTLHIYIDPLEQPPDGGTYDYLAQARKNVSTFKTLFPKAAPPEPSEENP